MMNPHSKHQRANRKIPFSTRIEAPPLNPPGGEDKVGFFKIRRDVEPDEDDEEEGKDEEPKFENEEDEDEEEEDEEEK